MMDPTLTIITANIPSAVHNVATPTNDNTISTTTADNASDNPDPNRRRVSTRPTNIPLNCVPAIIANEFTANSPAYVCAEAPNPSCQPTAHADPHPHILPQPTPTGLTGRMNRG